MKVTVITHDNKKLIAETEVFDAKAINEAMNDHSKTAICIGNLIVHRGIVSQIIPEVGVEVEEPAPIKTIESEKAE